MATDLNKLFNTLQALKGTQATPEATGAPRISYASASNTPAPTGTESLFGQVAQGGINAVGGLLRAVTSIGRANTNLANDVLPYANKIHNITADGFTPDEIDDYLGNIWNGTWAGLGGFAKGLAYSFMPPTADSANALQGLFGGETPVESAYDMFQTQNYIDAAKNLPWLQETRSEDKVGAIPDWAVPFDVPFLGIEAGKGMDITKAGLYSFAFDVLTDPFSFMTLGIGGAAKYGAKAVGTAAKARNLKAAAAREGRQLSVDEIQTVAPGRYYGLPEKTVPYNVTETNPLIYIGKEMGRGFADAHRATAYRIRSRRETRALNREFAKGITARVAAATDAEGRLDPNFSFENASREVALELQQRMEKQIGEANVKATAEEIAARIGEIKGKIDAKVPEFIARAEAKGLGRLDELKARAEAAGVSFERQLEADLMDDVARSFLDTTPAIRRTQQAKYDAEAIASVGTSIRAAADSPDGNIVTAWDNFRTETGAARDALKRLLSPLGTHEKGGVQKIRAGKATAEQREMMKRLSGDVKQKQGAGSQLMAEQGKVASVDKKALDGFVTALRKKLLGAGDTDAALEQLLKNADALDGATLQEALASIPNGFRIAGERLKYMGEIGQVRPTAEFNFIRSLRDRKYNPLTVELGSKSLNEFVVAGKGTALSEITRLSNKATGKWYPERLYDLLRRAGFRDNELLQGDVATNAMDFIEIALWRSIEAKTVKARAEIYKAKFGQFQLAELIERGTGAAPDLSDIHILEISNRAKGYGKNSLQLTDDEINEMIELAALAKDEQLSAIKKLADLGVDPFSEPGRIRTSLLGSRELAAAIKADAQTRTGYAPTKPLEEVKVLKRAVNFVKEISKGEDAIVDGPTLAKRLTEYFAKNFKGTVSAEVKELGREIRDVLSKQEGFNVPRARQANFSRLTNIIAGFEASTSRASVSGFDFAFMDVKGRYVRGAVANAMAFMYAGSAAKNSIDGGLFARRVDEVLLAGRDDLPDGLGSVKTLAERAKILESVADQWGGEGITFGLLQDALANAKGGRAAADALSPLEKKQFNTLVTRMFDQLVDENVAALKETAIPRVLFEEGMEYRVGWIERLTDEEAKIARNALANKVFEVDPELAKAANLKTNKLAYKDIARFLPGERDVARTKGNGALAQIAEDVAARANKAARDAVEDARARDLFNEVLPSWATREALAELSRASSLPRAQGALQMTTMMANMMIRTEAAAKVADRTVAMANKLGDKTPEMLRSERGFFNKIIGQLNTKFLKEGYKSVSPAAVAGKSFEEVLEMENPLAFLMWVKEVRTGTTAGTADWTAAMQHMMNLQVTGTGRAFRNARELLESYRDKGEGVRVATPREVIETIAALGNDIEPGKVAASYLNRKGLPQRRTILKLIDKAAPILEKSEIERARGNSWIKEINLAGGAEVEALAGELPDLALTAQKAQELLATTLVELESAKLGWISTLAMQSVGTSMRQFFMHRAQFLVKSTDDVLGRVIDYYQLPGAKDLGALKRSWEELTNYTGFKGMVDTIRNMAPTAKRGKLTEDEWVAKMTRLAMSVRDQYLLARGIVPVHTLSLKRGEAIPNQLADAIGKGAEEFKLKAVALTENDILDILPESDVVDLFFSTVDGSPRFNMPITAVMPAARMLVAAMDVLPAGKFFSEDQLRVLSRHMVDSMTVDAKKSSVSQGQKISLLNIDPDRAARAIETIVQRMLDPDNAFALFEKHLSNSLYAHGILKYSAGQMSEPIMDAWTEIATSPVASSSQRIEATLEATRKLNELLNINEPGTELERVMAVLDSQARLAMEIDIDSMIDVQAANKISKAGEDISDEAKAILKVQKASRKKATQDEINGALVEMMEAREPLLGELYALKIGELNNAGYLPTPDEQFMLFNDIITDQGKMNWLVSFTNAGLRAFSHDHLKEGVSPYLGGIARRAIEDQAEYTNIGLQYGLKWGNIAKETGKNYPGEAFAILQRISDEDMPRVTLAADTIMKLTSRQLKGAVKPKELKALKAGMDHMEFFKNLRDSDGRLLFPEDDPLMVQAVVDLWMYGGHLFGATGKVARAGIPAEWLNLQLRQIGSAEMRGAFKETDGVLEFVKQQDALGFNKNMTNPAELAQAWREWDIQDPFMMMSTLNSAIARGSKIVEEAAAIQKIVGFKNPTKEAIKEHGLVRIKGPDTMNKQGQELLYFMDTENYWFNADIASQIIKTSKDLYGPYNVLADVRKYAAKFDELQNFAKRSMTIFRLGNFIMNFNGGLWTNFLGGVTSPVAYYRGALLLRQLQPDLNDLPLELGRMEREVVKYHARRSEEGLTVRPENDPTVNKDSVTMNINGKLGVYSMADLAKIFRDIGGETSVASSRGMDLLRDAGSVEELQKLGGKNIGRAMQRQYERIALKIGRAAALRDDFIRSTMWLDELQKGKWKSLEDGARQALKKVDRYHPQVQDLSKFNSVVTRQFIMFFTWQAKTLGWIVSDLLDRPGAITATLRAQYAYQTSEGEQPEYFGSFDPKGRFLREWQQGQMNYLTGNLAYSFSYANPVNDLLGSNGWLSQINYKTYESPATNAMSSTMGSVNNFLYSSNPIFANLVLAWAAGRTAGGQDLMRSGSFNEESLSILGEEVAGQLGLTLPHAALALAYPELFGRRSWTEETTLDERQKDTLRYAFNWLTGMRSTEFLGATQQQKALSEIRSTLNRILQSRID